MSVVGESRSEQTGDTLVLCYHAISDTWPADLAVTQANFRAQIELLVERGYRGCTFHDAVAAPGSGRRVAVTFDDAFQSVLELAFPVLSSLDFCATVFVVTDFADGNRRLEWHGIDGLLRSIHEPDLLGLSWPQLQELAEAGWEIGSHTRTHRRLTQLSDEALAGELRESREACENAMGRPCRSVAYPYGDFDVRVADAASAAGYDAGATLPAALGRPTALGWPRVGVYRKDSLRRFRVKVSPTVRRLRTALAPVEARLRS
jgi:peptidoglycan/xylan/chitin deacetylase (PgdA/CDA1 family)